ncbi:putative bifunctional diguanylate cyclase/phosphodiesterase [Devosia sp. CN2-171]|uniref:putative bifunctional diguanylate cyclase/phosphodiesterase n=1 Tax=Devosia sp. CN2-171 TaxID=3400909 RepID=UPI003BF7EDEE
MRKLFDRQLEKATDDTGHVDLDTLGRLVAAAYEEVEQDRARTDRSIELMVGELMEFQVGLQAEIKRQTGKLRLSQERLRTQNTRFATALENMAQGLAMFDRHERLVVCNQQYLEMYSLPRRFGRRGTSLTAIIKARIVAGTSAGNDPKAYLEERLAAARDGLSSSATHHLNNGRVVSVSHRAMPDGGWVTMHKDITELHNMQAELAFQAYHDPLTELPNRNLFYQRLGLAFETLPPGGSFAVLCLDLDGFKAINDSMGHAAGDNLLRQVAARLRHCLGDGGTVGRMGGDEFAVLLPGATDDSATALAKQILEEIRRPFEIDAHAVLVGVSIGIAMAPRDGGGPDRLLQNGDLALYSIKRGRRGGQRFFAPDLAGAISDRSRLERDLRHALAGDELELHYQPVLDLTSRTITGFEALLRWHHPTAGMILPADFIPLAEELGLIAPIGEWAIHEALAEAAQWPSGQRIAINVSPVQFERGNLVGVVVDALAASGIAHERVELEITESALLAATGTNIEILKQLRGLGLGIALDDFGTGFSALSYLLDFPFDKLKIGGPFVAGDDGSRAAIVLGAVADIGRRMGIRTTVEGIETAAQLDRVCDMGFAEAQGFLIANPMPREAVHRLLRMSDAAPAAPRRGPERRATGAMRGT